MTLGRYKFTSAD